jgi:VWFA-related protein
MKYTILVAALSIFGLSAWAQAPAPADPVDVGELPTIQVDVDVVNILCTVRDKHGRLVSTLSKDDFVLEEDGVEQEIKYFAQETDLPLTIGLLVDVSKSQENLIEVEREAGYRFFSDVLREKDLAFIISFGKDSELLQDLTNSSQLLREGLDDLHLNVPVEGITPGTIPSGVQAGTVLYDAVFLSAEDMLRKEVGRKVVVVISDGVDTGSRMSKSEAVRAAHQADVIVYSIYYSDPQYSSYRNGFGDLKNISRDTGGGVFRVSRKNTLANIFAQIQDEMRNQYSLGYTPTNTDKDGGFRRVKINTKQKGMDVQARKGYYASRR